MGKTVSRPIVLDMFSYDKQFNDINLYINTEYFHYDIKHSHKFFEFAFIANGSVLNADDDNTTRFIKSDLVAIRPEYNHQLILDKRQSYTMYNIEVKSEFLINILSSLNGFDINDLLRTPVTHLHCSENEHAEIIQLFNQYQKQSSPRYKQFYLKLILIKYITKITASIKSNLIQANVPFSEIINDMLNALNSIDNFSLSTGQIAHKIGYSQEYVIRLFKQANLESPNKIFLKNKLVYSATLLTNSNIKIINIAERCGIYTISYFNRSFKKEFGESPSAYRKKHKTVSSDNERVYKPPLIT